MLWADIAGLEVPLKGLGEQPHPCDTLHVYKESRGRIAETSMSYEQQELPDQIRPGQKKAAGRDKHFQWANSATL